MFLRGSIKWADSTSKVTANSRFWSIKILSDGLIMEFLAMSEDVFNQSLVAGLYALDVGIEYYTSDRGNRIITRVIPY